MKRLIYGVLATLVFVIGLVVQMPATVVASKVQEIARQRISLGDVRGTVWSGKARVACVRPDKSSERCGEWQWTFVPNSLLELKARWTLRGSTPTDMAVVSWSAQGVQLESLATTVPAFYIATADPKLESLQLGGRLRVNGKQLATKDGQADVQWANLSSRLLPNINLGELTLIFVAGPQGWNVGLSSGNGPVRIAGEGQLSPKGQITLNATLAVGSDRAALAPLINVLGAESTPSVYRLQLP